MSYTSLGTRILEKTGLSSSSKHVLYKVLAFVLTYLTYASYHIAKRPIAMIANSPSFLNCTAHDDWDTDDANCTSWIVEFHHKGSDEAHKQIHQMGTVYIFVYAFCMFFSGALAERMDLRYYLSIGLLLNGLVVYMAGFARLTGIDHLWYFYFCQVLLGLVNSTGFPGVVAVLGNWFGKEGIGRIFGRGTRGLLMGAWNSHQYVGNMVGLYFASTYADEDWALCFIMPALVVGAAGLLVYLFLVPRPEDVGLVRSAAPAEKQDIEKAEQKDKEKTEESAISFLGALRIPGVIEFSLGVFCAKLVGYTFLFWLPGYIEEKTGANAVSVGEIANFFDYGSIAGAIMLGFASDMSGGLNALLCTICLAPSIPLIYYYNVLITDTCPLTLTADESSFVSNSCYTNNVVVLFFAGCLVNGPFSLITTAVSAELGQHESLKGSSKALATVTAIIDGTGSLGGGVGPLIASQFSSHTNSAIVMVMVSAGLAILFLLRLVWQDIQKIRHRMG